MIRNGRAMPPFYYRFAANVNGKDLTLYLSQAI
jgi:hypothetical protein